VGPAPPVEPELRLLFLSWAALAKSCSLRTAELANRHLRWLAGATSHLRQELFHMGAGRQ